MDPVTHFFAGAVLSDAMPVSKRTGSGQALYAGMVAASPDLDLLPAFIASLPGNLVPGNRLFSPEWMWLHRGYTHSLSIVLLAGLAAGIAGWRLWGKGTSVWRWLALAIAALLSHLGLDIMNGGVQFWLPFSDEWLHWGEMPVVDLFTMLVLIVCSIANHPPAFANRNQWGTLTTLSKVGTFLHYSLAKRIGERRLALLGMALAGGRVLLGNIW